MPVDFPSSLARSVGARLAGALQATKLVITLTESALKVAGSKLPYSPGIIFTDCGGALMRAARLRGGQASAENGDGSSDSTGL